MVSVEVSMGGDDLDDVEASNERGAQDGSVHRALGSLAFGEALLRGGLLSLCGGWVCVVLCCLLTLLKSWYLFSSISNRCITRGGS